MIVTIDGPAGAGKSSVAKLLASRLGFSFLDTGATYRCVALAAIKRNLSWSVAEKLAALADEISIELNEQQVLLDGEDVTKQIRSSEVASVIHYVADNPEIRQKLVALQRRIAQGKDIVTEGRDQGTVAFPRAQCKIFLTATPEERARRRLLDLQSQGEEPSLKEVLARQNQRDQRDASRPVGRLLAAEDAIEVLTDGLTKEQVVARLEEIVKSKMKSS